MPPSRDKDVDALGATVAVDTDGLAAAATIASTRTPVPSAERSRFPGSEGEIDLKPFGPYTRVEPLHDQGSMGFVAKGYNQPFDRWELLKFLRADHALDPSRVRQFHREGRVLAKLSHPNVVQVFAIHQMEGRPCLAMEYLHGRSLAKVVHQSDDRLPVDQWYALFLDAARGLAAAHQVGLLHRDLKPDNLFVVNDAHGGFAGLKLIDFGLATADQTRRQEEEGRSSLIADLSGGTPVFMAPELWAGELATPRTDLFALGLTFTFAVAGRLPFEASTVLEAYGAINDSAPFPDPRDARPDLPRRLADVLRKATAKAPEQRFSSVDDLIAALVAAWQSSRPRRVPGSGPYRGLQPYSRSERDVFFGREEETAAVLEKVRLRGSALVVGASGSGKTSLVQAGVVPALLEGALGNDLSYRLLPIALNQHPLQAIATAVSSATTTPEAEVMTFLSRSPERLGAALRESLQQGEGFVVLLDPLDALAGDGVDPAETRRACLAIASVMEPVRPELCMLSCVRADRMDRLFAEESLRSWLTQGFHPIRPLEGEALRSALVEPARTAGFEVDEPAILDRIVADAERLDAGLPLLSFAMQAWWERRDEGRRVLPREAWVAFGGVAGALAGHAETVVAVLDRDLRAAVEATLVRLVRGDGTRRRVARGDLLDPGVALARADDALEVLLQARVVQESFGQVEIVHDALLTQWPRLVSLVETAGEDRGFRDRLTGAASVWEAQGRTEGALWTGDQAAELVRWLPRTKATLTQSELAFAEAVQRRASRKRLLLRSVVAALGLLAVGFVTVAKTNELAMASKLEGALEERNQARNAFKKAEAERLRLLSDVRVSANPREALELAARSYDLETHPLVDVLAWRAHARGIPHAIPAPAGGAAVVRFSPSGNWLALGGTDGSLLILATSKETHRSVMLAGGAAGTISSIAFSPDERRIAVGSSAGWAGVGTLEDQRIAGRKVAAGVVRGIEWVGDEVFGLSRGGDGISQLLRVDGESKVLATGRWVASEVRSMPLPAADGQARLSWVGEEGAARSEVNGEVVTVVDVVPGRLALGTREGGVWVGGKGEPMALLTRHPRGIRRARWSPDGLGVLSLDERGSARLTSARGEVLRSGGGLKEAAVWIPARQAVAVVSRERRIELWSSRTGEVLAELSGFGQGTVLSLDADPLGRWLVVSTSDGGVHSFALEEAAWRVERGPHEAAPERCALAADGSAVACGWPGRIEVERLGETESHRTISRSDEGEVLALAVAKEGKGVAWATSKGFWEEGKAGGTPAGWLAYGHDGKLVVGAVSGTGLSVSREGKSLGADELFAMSRGPQWLGRRGKQVVVLGAGQPAEFLWEGADPAVAGAWADDGSFAVATASGRLGLGREGPIESVGSVGGKVACLAFARTERTLLVGADSVVFFDTQSKQGVFEQALPSAVQACARVEVEDRFVFVSRDGSVRTRWLDLAPLATRALGSEPALDAWSGLPSERAW